MIEPLLSLSNVGFSQNGRALLSGIDFSIFHGQVLGLLGVNGAGKSTVLKIAAGSLSPSVGVVNVAQGVRVGFLPEAPALIPDWTVRDLLLHASALYGVSKGERQAAMDRVVVLCDLDNMLYRKSGVLSKGNQQRVAIAQALLHSPNVLVLDEPTSGLDPEQIARFRCLIDALRSDVAVVFSSHIMQEVSVLCDRVVIVHDGLQMQTMDLKSHADVMFIDFLEGVDPVCFSGLSHWQSGEGKTHQFRVASHQAKNDVLQFCLDKGLTVDRVSGVTRQLEQEFLSLIGREVLS